jgi:solute carrier family 15 (peptide/histidine transporter), member 3/4
MCSYFQTSSPPFFQTVLTVLTSMVNFPNLLNLVTYVRGTLHMGVSDSATTITNFVGATSGFALIGAFLSDSYITRSRTILFFGPLEFLVIFSWIFSTINSSPNLF